ncbi:SDR family NAD(P)-dependent oxidoreductase [Legionella pneumophila serogroup 1]|uniref:SDR family oxidoreductase n=1 Tax=Legionella pneumophila TaxID=446 RepID=UPI0001E3C768|nr:SDR family NAD(P)-dependent oxidoreductase [Legionella pneumophila]HAT9040176.1 SDR family NAD(P)-dependent oxidoreductase [Legionella pneumophila subsp. pneumophila]TIE23142.1 SDR family oxidoreductase [Legionella pneumophila]TIE29288.1 SDR family oxidoreductase [Legionella pneumophila]TIE50793.1 SDR family oxidoreductase [Legionella pneumophila]WBV72389.1 SDR family NAD(P)-dependent oxidoreductase [Legionella pneumophila]
MTSTYIITGAGKGSGRFFAKTVAELGHDIALISRTASDLESLKIELQRINANIKISTHAIDLSDPLQTKKAFDVIHSVHDQTIKAVICFAGSWIKSKPIELLETSDFLEGLQSNFFCTFNTIKETIRISREALDGLVIITIGGTSSVWMNPEAPVMSVAKGAVSHYSRVLAKQLLSKGIHVAHLIIDGPILNERGLALNPDFQENEFIKPVSIAREIHHVINQSHDAWTFEWDIRPFTRHTKLI